MQGRRVLDLQYNASDGSTTPRLIRNKGSGQAKEQCVDWSLLPRHGIKTTRKDRREWRSGAAVVWGKGRERDEEEAGWLNALFARTSGRKARDAAG